MNKKKEKRRKNIDSRIKNKPDFIDRNRKPLEKVKTTLTISKSGYIEGYKKSKTPLNNRPS